MEDDEKLIKPGSLGFWATVTEAAVLVETVTPEAVAEALTVVVPIAEGVRTTVALPLLSVVVGVPRLPLLAVKVTTVPLATAVPSNLVTFAVMVTGSLMIAE